MELRIEPFDVLCSRRLQRDRWRREAALRDKVRAAEAVESKPQSLGARYPPRPRGWWECGMCQRGFHGYGRFLNHNCHEADAA